MDVLFRHQLITTRSSKCAGVAMEWAVLPGRCCTGTTATETGPQSYPGLAGMGGGLVPAGWPRMSAHITPASARPIRSEILREE